MPNLEKVTNLVESYSVMNCIKIFRKIETPAQAFQSGMNSLSEIVKTHGENKLLIFIKMWLVNLNDYVNTARKLTPMQIDEIAVFISTDYYYFNIADIHLIFTNIKKGVYGQLYEGLDGIKIMSFFEKYDKERVGCIVSLNESEDSKYKSNDVDRKGDFKTLNELLNK